MKFEWQSETAPSRETIIRESESIRVDRRFVEDFFKRVDKEIENGNHDSFQVSETQYRRDANNAIYDRICEYAKALVELKLDALPGEPTFETPLEQGFYHSEIVD